MIYEVVVGEKSHRVELKKDCAAWACSVDGRAVAIDAAFPRRDVLSLLVDGRSYEIRREQAAGGMQLSVGGARFAVDARDPRSLRARQSAGANDKGPRKIVAPMPGRVVRVLVGTNAAVEAGQGIVVVEAMKMQNEIKSPKKGVVKSVAAVVGAAVNPGDVLAVVD